MSTTQSIDIAEFRSLLQPRPDGGWQAEQDHYCLRCQHKAMPSRAAVQKLLQGGVIRFEVLTGARALELMNKCLASGCAPAACPRKMSSASKAPFTSASGRFQRRRRSWEPRNAGRRSWCCIRCFFCRLHALNRIGLEFHVLGGVAEGKKNTWSFMIK